MYFYGFSVAMTGTSRVKLNRNGDSYSGVVPDLKEKTWSLLFTIILVV